MRTLARNILALGVVAAAGACADGGAWEGAAVNRAAFSEPVTDAALEAIGGRYIVKYVNADAGRTALRAAGAEIVLELGPQNAAAAHIPEQALAGLSRNPNIEYIEEDAHREPYASGVAETVPYGIGLVQANQVTFNPASGIKVCIIDSGFMVNHEDLQDTSVTGYPTGWDTDNCGHGSHVGGTIAAMGGNAVGVVGVIPTGATTPLNLHIVKVFGDGTPGNCNWSYSSSLVDALNRCVAAGSDVVSMSLGGGSPSVTEENAFNNAYANGVLSVAAAGNSGTSTGSTDPLSYPASYASVMSVAALDQNKVHATFSQENSQVEIAAPGVSVLSTVTNATDVSVTVNGARYNGSPIELAATSTGVTGTLANGGLCDATNAAWAGQVVLCERGTVSFLDKVRNVQTSGGVAALIYNNVSGGFVGTLGAGNSSTIPAISLTQADGKTLVSTQVGQSARVVNVSGYGLSGYEAWNGTSMATPHVSAVAALVWSHFPNKSAADIRAALTQSALDLGTAGRDITFGFGLVQAKAAYDLLAGGGGSGGGIVQDTTPPVISNVKATLQNRKLGRMTISWTTDEASDSKVNLSDGSTLFDPALITSHALQFRGTKGATYTYTVSSKDAAGNASTSAMYSFTIPR